MPKEKIISNNTNKEGEITDNKNLNEQITNLLEENSKLSEKIETLESENKQLKGQSNMDRIEIRVVNKEKEKLNKEIARLRNDIKKITEMKESTKNKETMGERITNLTIKYQV